MKIKKNAVILLGLLASLVSSRAASVYSDNFAYPDGGIVANSSGAWVPNTGTAGSCLVSNQTLLISTARTEDIAHQFAATYTTNGSVAALYSSFTLRCTNTLPTSGGAYFAHFAATNAFNSLGGHRARIWAATTNYAGASTAPAGQFYLYIVNSVGNTTNGNNQWLTPLTTNATYQIVTKYVLATGLSTLWVNPTAESDPSVTDSIPLPADFNASGVATNGILNITHYGFRQATGEGNLLVDDLKIGTAFNDVAGADTAPTISPIPTQNTPATTAIGPINFTVGDAETAAAALTLTAGSSNPTLVPTNSIVFGGSGANRTVTITPASSPQGSSTITISVNDGANISSTAFLLKVGAPTIGAIPNQITHVNVAAGPASFTVSDAEGDTLIFTKGSSNPTLLPTNNVVVTGSGSTRTVTLTPAAGQTGVSTVTLTVSDGFNSSTTSFVLSVSPQLGVLFSDTFSYTDFLQETALQGAMGTPDSPWGSASGTAYDLLVINGTAQLSSLRTEDLGASLASTIAVDSGVILYASFSITFSNLPTSAGDYFCHFRDTRTGSTFREKVYACTANAAGGKFRIGVASAANNFTGQFPLDLNTNQAYLVVLRYNSGTGESVLWVNPGNEGSLSVAAQDPTAPSSIAAFGLRQNSGIGISYLDNLVIGTAFTDVATIIPDPTPEPILPSKTLDGKLILSWNQAAFSLASATNVAGPYVKISGATSPYTNGTSSGTAFFRLVYP